MPTEYHGRSTTEQVFDAGWMRPYSEESLAEIKDGRVLYARIGATKKLLTKLWIICVLVLIGFVCPSITHAQSQGEMNNESYHDLEIADKKLNKVYEHLMGAIDEQAQAKLKTTQLAWIAFRDAEAALEADFEARGGTMAPTIYNACRTHLTELRTDELDKLVKDYGN